MKPIKTTILLAAILTLSFTTGAAQQTNIRRAPALTSEDLKDPEGSNLKTSPASKTTAYEVAKWQRYSPGELALSIELPGKPTLFGITLPEGTVQQLRPAKAYTYQGKEITVFVFRFSVQRPPVRSTDLRTFAAGFLEAPTNKPGVSDVENQTKIEDDSTVLLRGSYKVGGVVFATRGFVYTKGSDVWLVATRFLQADEFANEFSHRVINSVKIN